MSLLLYSLTETRNCPDQSLRAICENKENCRRHTVLQALGSGESTSVSKRLCCDVCESVCPYSELAFTFVSMPKKRQLKVHPICADILQSLEAQLITERDTFIANNPPLKMLPKSVICPVSVIKEVALRSKSINCIEDMRLFSCLRPEFYTPFFNAVIEYTCTPVGSASSAKRSCIRS